MGCVKCMQGEKMKWINNGYENIKGSVKLIWECSNCHAEFYGDNGLKPPEHDCPICKEKNDGSIHNENA